MRLFTLVMNSNKGYQAQIEIGTYMLHDMPRWLIGDEGTCFIQDFQAKEGNIIKAEQRWRTSLWC